VRDINTEFRLLRKLTETKDHLANQEKCGSHLNRYSDLKPFKHTRVRLVQRNADIADSYINANYINSAIQVND
jgi:protein tyrosine phosphatase